MKLSIIICVYNTPREYLDAALHSIKNSTLQKIEGEYEICMVDDGSTLDYTELVKLYGVKYTKTENRGILSARLTGARMATGEYSAFFDSDDTVSYNYHLPMLRRAEDTDADIAFNGWATHTERARYYPKKDCSMLRTEAALGDGALKCFLENEGRQHSFYVLWNKLFRTSLLKGAFEDVISAAIAERTSYSEDAAICFYAFKEAKRVEFVNTGLYFYRIHGSQVVNPTSEEKLRAQIDGMTATLAAMRTGIVGRADEAELLVHVNEWAALMARAHYSVARGAGYLSLYPYIKEKYGIKSLSLSTVRDGEVYEHKILLGDNFEEVDSILLGISCGNEPVRVKYPRRTPYIARAVRELTKEGMITTDTSAKLVVIPKYKIPFKKKLLYNAFLYKMGLIFFKKGSRARNFLKKFI